MIGHILMSNMMIYSNYNTMCMCLRVTDFNVEKIFPFFGEKLSISCLEEDHIYDINM